MTKQEYIVATNRVKVSMSIRMIRDMATGDDSGVSTGQTNTLLGILTSMEEKMFIQLNRMRESEDE